MGLPRDVPSAGFSWEAAGLRNDGGRGLRRYGHPPASGRLRLYLPVRRREFAALYTANAAEVLADSAGLRRQVP